MSYSHPRGVVTRTAVWSSEHPWIALLIWVIAIIATASLSSVIGTRDATDTERLTGESRHAAELTNAADYPEAATELVLITGQLTDQNAATLSSELSETEHVGSVVGPIPSDSGKAVLYQVTIDGDPDTAAERIDPLRDTVTSLNEEFQSLSIRQTGDASIADDFENWLGEDLDRATLITLPTTLLILLVAFGAIVIAVLPIVVGAAAVFSGVGLWAVASQVVPDTGIVAHVITLIGMAVGIDYALFYSRRYREEVHGGRGPLEATDVASRTAVHSILVSGTAVVLAMAGLLVVREPLYSGASIGAILVVLVAMASAVTAMPALMRLLHRWIDRPRLPLLWRIANGNRENTALRAVLRPVIRHPWVALGIAVIGLGAMATPTLTMTLSTTTIDDYPSTLGSLQVYNDVRDEFPDASSSVRIVVTDDSSDTKDLETFANAIAERTATHPKLFGTPEEPWLSKDGSTLVLDVPVPYESTTPEAQNALLELRTNIVPGALGPLADADHAVGGPIAENFDATADLAASMPWVIGMVILLTFVYMFVIYRSFAIAFTTIALNIASTFAAFGLTTLIFQNTWAEKLLGFTSNGALVSWVPLLLFVVLSGLSLDYHVLVVNRIRESARLGMRAQHAILDGVTKTAGVVTTAAAVMIVVFAIFGSLSFIELKQIGVALAIATLLDVTLIRVVTLPAIFAVASKVLWWPGQQHKVPDVDSRLHAGRDEIIADPASNTDQLSATPLPRR